MTPPTPFFYPWIPGWAPSWLVELASGLILVGVLALVLLLPWWLRLGVLATAASVVYEARFDPNGWSLADVAQRELGIVVGIILWRLVARVASSKWKRVRKRNSPM
jgi:uncharacterized membrane protein